jgi:hypothetical protein
MSKKRIEEDGYFWDEEADQWFPIGSEEDASGGKATALIGGTGDRTKPDDGFKEVLSKIADANPTSKLADDYGKKDKKSVAVRDSMKRVKKKLGSISE